MTKNLLVELGLEELPAYVVTPSEKQLGEKMAAFLDDNRLSYESIQTFSTPRRLAVRVIGLADQQSDLTEDFKGPSKKIALDADGNFSKAAQGFVRGKGLTVDDIEFREVKGEEYVYVTKHEAGKPAKEVLAGLPEVLASLTFPVSMHWANNTFEYIRPVHTLIVLLGDEALDLDFLDIKSGRVSRGHRFLGHEVEITNADSYEEDLRTVYVIADSKERENMIREQIKAIEAEQGVQVQIEEGLLNEVLNLVEYPTAFMGSFDTKYLDVPEEVLVTSMETHQRYFVVRDLDGQLKPNFISVRNGNAEHLENVIRGNEKVLVARLEDGEFFWREDQKLKIEDLVAKLANVTFHEKIGSLSEHMARAGVIAASLAEQAGLTAEETAAVARAAEIYKFDLLTGMVGEFDELQGIMGEKYALLAGEDAAVATAIREHYLPDSADGALPETKVGAILALADKLDTLLSFFSVGLIPSGSNDPYALRRATQGIVRILDAFGWHIPMDELIDSLYGLSFDSLSYDNQAEVLNFIKARVDKMMGRTPKDIKDAVLAGSNFVVADMLEAAEALSAFLDDNRLSYESIQTFSTPRRLAVRVIGLADQQSDLTEDFKGPSKKIALDADGNFSKAAQGFVRGKGLTVDDIEFREVKGEEYVYVDVNTEAGKPAKEVLAGVPEVLASLTFPVSMHWANNTFEYIRPVHTLTVLLGDEALDLDFLDIKSGRVSRGHRFLGHEVEITNADSYEEDLRTVYVIADSKERENMIREQIKAIEAEQGVQVQIEEGLLNEVLNLVEYPTAFMGSFDTKYLDVPEEVLVTSMETHQRYFVVRDLDGQLKPNFISVRNGNAEHLENVIRGNEKVLVARLEDGEFFWREDQKLKIEYLVAKLANVTFHEKIGSLSEHMARAGVIAASLAEQAGLTAEERAAVARAAEIYKFDLLTGMVGEFDELQGIMGEKYALLAGEDAAVATAIREHYLPDSADGALPETKVGAILALADKLDTLLSFFSVGLIPSGSNDPYALRRATQGIVRILDAFGWHIPMDELIDSLYGLSFDSLSYDNQAEVLNFIKARVDKMMGTHTKRYQRSCSCWFKLCRG